MAVQRKRDPDLEALIHRAAAEIRRANPSIGQSLTSTTEPAMEEEAVAAIEAVDADLARLWDTPEGEQIRQLDYSISQAIDEDRGA